MLRLLRSISRVSSPLESAPFRTSVLSGLMVGLVVLVIQFLGGLQLWELSTYDALMRWRPLELPDERIVIVGIEQQDLDLLNTAVIPDNYVADLLRTVNQAQPRLIGLDLFRNLPIEPGNEDLTTVLRQTPNLIGIEQILDPAGVEPMPLIPGHPGLVATQRVAASDIPIDIDGRVRRGFFFPDAVDHVVSSLSLRLALDYLAAEEIFPEPEASVLTLNQVRFFPFNRNDGGYVRADQGGYQVLLNPRHTLNGFTYVTARQVMTQVVPAGVLRDRIVLIGSTIPAHTDIFQTVYPSAIRPKPPTSGSFQPTRQFMYGIEVHAHLLSQVISAVLDQRPVIRVLSPWWDRGLVLLTTLLITAVYHQNHRHWRSSHWQNLLTALGILTAIALGSYGLLLLGWWVSPVPLLLAGVITMGVMTELRSRQLKNLSNRDELTQLANRRVFNQVLQREWQRGLRSQHPLAVIFCDVDYFKKYNDTYGHPQGDYCLRQVAKALSQTARRSSDLVARYGGEEFVLLLPNTDLKTAVQLAERMNRAVRSLRLAHQAAPDHAIVTISVGVTSLIPHFGMTPQDLCQVADQALYLAKADGRNCVRWQVPKPSSVLL